MPRGSGSGLERVRGLADVAGCKIALVGDLRLASVAGEHPQVRSRLRRPVMLHTPEPEDVDALAASAWIADPGARDVLRAVAQLPGALRDVETVLQLASMAAGSTRIGAGHIAAAVRDLGFDRPGAGR